MINRREKKRIITSAFLRSSVWFSAVSSRYKFYTLNPFPVCSVLMRLCFPFTVSAGSVVLSYRGSHTNVQNPVHVSRSVPSVSRLLGVAGVPLLVMVVRGYVCEVVEITLQEQDHVWRMTSDKAKDTGPVSTQTFCNKMIDCSHD